MLIRYYVALPAGKLGFGTTYSYTFRQQEPLTRITIVFMGKAQSNHGTSRKAASLPEARHHLGMERVSCIDVLEGPGVRTHIRRPSAGLAEYCNHFRETQTP